MPSRSPDPTARSSPRAWSGSRRRGPASGWAGAARSSFTGTTWCLYAEPMTAPALEQLAGRVRAAARVVAQASSSVRDDALRLAADLLEQEGASLVQTNQSDLARAEAAGMAPAAQD